MFREAVGEVYELFQCLLHTMAVFREITQMTEVAQNFTMEKQNIKLAGSSILPISCSFEYIVKEKMDSQVMMK